MGMPVIGGSDGAWGTVLTTFLGGAAGDGTPTIANNRIPYFSSGNHAGSANLTFDGTTLTAHTLTVSTGALTVTPVGGHSFGGAASVNAALTIRGAFTPLDAGQGIRIAHSLTAIASNECCALNIVTTIIEAGSGVHTLLAGAISNPVITAGVATVTTLAAFANQSLEAQTGTTNAAVYYADIAPTGATNNYAIWMKTGNIRFGVLGSGAVQSDANGVLSVSSDERLKDIRGKFTLGLAELLRIDPILFKWNEESKLDRDNIYVGFSAQNVMKFIPEAVGKDPAGYYSLMDRSLLAALVNAVKTLKSEIDEIRASAGLKIKPFSVIEVLNEERIIVSPKYEKGSVKVMSN